MKPLIDFGTEEQKQRLLAADRRGRARFARHHRAGRRVGRDRHATTLPPDGDDIVVDGGKTFITNGDVADLYSLFGKWCEIEDSRRQAISALILEKGTPGLRRSLR